MNKISSNFSLKDYNTFNIDAKSDKFISINSEGELIDFLSQHKGEENIFFLGGEVMSYSQKIIMELSFIFQ